jgi:hypothetical protein
VKWLLDSHVPAAVAAAVLKRQPSWSVEHVSLWQEGVWRNVDDDLLLEACHEDARVLVSKDRRTLPGWVALRASEGKDHAGILFYDEERFPARAIGRLAKAIVRAGQGRREWKNAWVTLR